MLSRFLVYKTGIFIAEIACSDGDYTDAALDVKI